LLSAFTSKTSKRQQALRCDTSEPKNLVHIILDSDPSLTSQRLQVLFHSLSKVLFIFRSRYLCAIGLPVIFSLGSGIPANSHCIPKQYYSDVCKGLSLRLPENGAITLYGDPFQGNFSGPSQYNATLTPQSPCEGSDWTFPTSLAATKGITVVFFSSA